MRLPINKLSASIFVAFIFVAISTFAQTSTNNFLPLRFIDSETGFAVQPEIWITPAGSTVAKILPVDISGRAFLTQTGIFNVQIVSTNYQPVSTSVEVGTNNLRVQFVLDPLIRPKELNSIESLHRNDATIFVGFVADENSGQPLANALVKAWPSGITSNTDARGFFQIAVPLQNAIEATNSPASLLFEKNGFQSERHLNLELWANGDWTWRIQLSPGSGEKVVDEGGRKIIQSTNLNTVATFNKTEVQGSSGPVLATLPANATIRIPRTIRVLLADDVTIEYVSMEMYVRRGLPREWIASWGNYSGGINCLKAGGVASRSYAAYYVNNPRATTYDICATTSCQVYGSTTSSTTDNAVTNTPGYVVIGSNNLIQRSEYSSENNSMGNSCDDGYTEPSTTGPVCLYDPVCSGETRYGHGRGMCQWGTVKWATGLKFPGNSSANTTTLNGQPKRDWIWIVNHYYPSYRLVQGLPLVIGDDVKIVGSAARDVRMCTDGSISGGVNCPLITTKSPGAIGVILTNAVQVTTDGLGYTWHKIQWSDGAVGWSPENWLERIIPPTTTPTNLLATAISPSQINLTWADTTDAEGGVKIERALSTAGPWTQIIDVAANVTNFSDTTVFLSTTYYYRVRAFNSGGNSSYSTTANAKTPGLPPVLPTIANRTVTEGTLLTFTNSATAPDFVQSISDFESFVSGTSSGSVLLRNPRTSGSTSTNINISPDFSSVTDIFPTNGNTSSRVLFVNCNFTNSISPWLRLTTLSATTFPNPVIDLTKRLRFSIYSDRAIRIAVGCRETTTASGTAIGSDGGSTGNIEWAGVTNKNGAAPMPTRLVASNVWTSVLFNFPSEAITSFSSGNGILSTASGLGVLEHLAIVPSGNVGLTKIYLDNVAVLIPKVLTYSLDTNAPNGASVNPSTGVFSWTPTESQGPGNYAITVRVTDNASPALSDAKTFSVTVGETNSAPVLAAITNHTIHVGSILAITNNATDSDIPTNTLSYALLAGFPGGATLNPTNGLFSWTPTDAQESTTNSISIRVTDNGSPSLSDTKSFSVIVVSKPFVQSSSISGGIFSFTWSAIPGKRYRIEFKNDLNDLVWNNLAEVTATGDTASISDAVGNGARFYRIVVL